MTTSDSEHSKNDEEAKRERRRAANRRSARKSRYREMVMLEELQKSVHELTVKNNALRQENDALRRGISAVKNFRQEQKLPSSLGSDILSNPSILPMLAQQGAAPAPEPSVSLSAAALGQAGANTLGNLSGLTSSAPAPADARTNEQLAAANIPLNYLQLLSGANAFQGGLGGI